MQADVTTYPSADSGSFLKGLPWVIGIPVAAFISWWFWDLILASYMGQSVANLASIGISTMGAYAICLMALADNWPFQNIGNKRMRGIWMLVTGQIAGALLFIILYACNVNLEMWTFPIIANSWLILAATSFVGGDFHLQQIPPLRRMFLNLLISAGMTILLMRTIVIFPALWFPFLQVTIITGGLGWAFRKTRQPVFSILVWSLLMFLMFLFLTVATWCGEYELFAPAPQSWGWNIGAGTPEFNVFFALTCGLNFAVLACTQCWPFSRLPQPFGTMTAVFSMLLWCLLACWGLIAIFRAFNGDNDPLGNAQTMAWHTVFWGFAWVYCFGVGQTPYLWKGQKTPGTWDDVD